MKIYMFHYVLDNFNYYHFDTNSFEKVIKNLTENYNVISLSEYDKYQKAGTLNTKECVMLTFDDGTIDHYKVVYPILKKYNCSGLFFIPSCAFTKKVLNIQIIHHLLALNKFEEMYNFLNEELKKSKYILNDIEVNNTLDNNDVATFKQLLQYKLPNKLRNKLINKLAKKYNISIDVNDYYINLSQLKEMKKNGMYFGLHTMSHPNLCLLSYGEQFKEINDNLNELKQNKIVDDNLLSIAYPFGIYNEETKKVMKQLNIKYGFKTHSSNEESNYEINRIDCKMLKEEK